MNLRATRVAVLVLTFCCIAWGFSFPAMQIGIRAFERAATTSAALVESPAERVAVCGIFNAWRFGLAGACMLAIVASGPSRYRRRDLIGGIVVGALFSGGMLLQTCGLEYTLPSVSSFLTALTVLFTPFAQALLLRRRVGSRQWLAVGIAVAGVIALSCGNVGARTGHTLARRPPVPLLGETLTTLGAVVFTAQILAVDHWGRVADAGRLTAIMLLAAAAVSLLAAVPCGGAKLQSVRIAIRLARDPTFTLTFIPLVLFSSVAALLLMNAWQHRIAPATAAVVYCLEPVFGTLFSVAFRTERLTLVTLTGGAAVLAAVLTVAARPNRNRS